MGSPFTPGIDYRGSNLTIEYELVCLVNYFFIIIIVIQYCFWKQKKEFGKAIKKSAGCRIFVKKERDFGFRTPPPLSDPVTQVEIQLSLLENKW